MRVTHVHKKSGDNSNPRIIKSKQIVDPHNTRANRQLSRGGNTADSNNGAQKTNDSIFEVEEETKNIPNADTERRSECNERAMNIQPPLEINTSMRNNDISLVKSKKEETDELSLYSSKAPTNQLKSSVLGLGEESMTAKPDSKSNIDWITTGLYRIFKNLYQKYSTGFPKIENKALKLTAIPITLSDHLFDKYYEEKILNRSDRRKDILKDVHAEAGLKYIKRNLSYRYGAKDQSQINESELDQSFAEFNKVVQNYYQLGMETLKYLMDLLNLSKNYERVLQAYDRNSYEDVLK